MSLTGLIIALVMLIIGLALRIFGIILDRKIRRDKYDEE